MLIKRAHGGKKGFARDDIILRIEEGPLSKII